MLLVEDDADLAEFIRTGLEEEHWEVRVVHRGGAGLREAELHHFNILVLDVMLPDIDGFEITRRLRRQNINTPILLLTGRDSPEDVVRGLDAGADDYLTKPFLLRCCLLASAPGPASRSRVIEPGTALPICPWTKRRGRLSARGDVLRSPAPNTPFWSA